MVEEQQSCTDAGVTKATEAPLTAAASQDLAKDKKMPCPQESTIEHLHTVPREPLRDEPICSAVETDGPSFSAPACATFIMNVDEPSTEVYAVVAVS